MVWLVGSDGLLGKAAGKCLTQYGMEWAGGDSVDITQAGEIEKFLSNNVRRIKWIINCAAYTDVEAAEKEEEKAREVNAIGCLNLSRAARSFGMRLVHISTNYVFDGKKTGPYLENDPLSPINAYGRTKAEGEENIAKEMTQFYILRTSCLYGDGAGFVHKMTEKLNSGAISGKEVRAVFDQKVCPTFAGDAAEAVIKLIRKADAAKTLFGKDSPAPYGVYHYCGAPAVSIAEYAQTILELGKKYGKIKGECKIVPCSTEEYISKLLTAGENTSCASMQKRALRPSNGELDCTKIAKALKIRIPQWKNSLEMFMKG